MIVSAAFWGAVYFYWLQSKKMAWPLSTGDEAEMTYERLDQRVMMAIAVPMR